MSTSLLNTILNKLTGRNQSVADAELYTLTKTLWANGNTIEKDERRRFTFKRDEVSMWYTHEIVTYVLHHEENGNQIYYPKNTNPNNNDTPADTTTNNDRWLEVSPDKQTIRRCYTQGNGKVVDIYVLMNN